MAAECCTPSSPAVDPRAVTIYTELVEAGCMAPDDGGIAAIAQEHALLDQAPWLGCLWDGGSLTSCAVFCSGPSGPAKR